MITKLSDIDAPVAAAGGVRCYVDICIARSTEMASIGLLFQRFIGIEALE